MYNGTRSYLDPLYICTYDTRWKYIEGCIVRRHSVRLDPVLPIVVTDQDERWGSSRGVRRGN